MAKHSIFLTVITLAAIFLFCAGITYIKFDTLIPPAIMNILDGNVDNGWEARNGLYGSNMGTSQSELNDGQSEDYLTESKASSIKWEDAGAKPKDEKPFNVLLLGGDEVYNNTDTIILANFNPSPLRVSLLSIPRDTKVIINGVTRKINFAYPKGGGALAMETVEKLLNVRIKYYVFIDIEAFRKIVDLLGGVEFYVPMDMYYEDPGQGLHINLKKGYQLLDGRKAEQLVRFRSGYRDADISRIKVQQDFIRAFIKQKLNIKYLPKIKEAAEVIFGNVETNMPLSEALNLITYLGEFDNDNIKIMTLPGYVSEKTPGWYFIPYKNNTKAIIQKYFNSQ